MLITRCSSSQTQRNRAEYRKENWKANTPRHKTGHGSGCEEHGRGLFCLCHLAAAQGTYVARDSSQVNKIQLHQCLPTFFLVQSSCMGKESIPLRGRYEKGGPDHATNTSVHAKASGLADGRAFWGKRRQGYHYKPWHERWGPCPMGKHEKHGLASSRSFCKAWTVRREYTPFPCSRDSAKGSERY